MEQKIKEYRIELEDLFIERLDRFSEKERDLIFEKIDFLKSDPSHPSLRTKKLRRYSWENLHESSINMGIRLIWKLDGDTIHISDVGRHDILRKYG